MEKEWRRRKQLPIKTIAAPASYRTHTQRPNKAKEASTVSFFAASIFVLFLELFVSSFHPIIYSLYFHPFFSRQFDFVFRSLVFDHSLSHTSTKQSFQFPHAMLTNLFVLLFTWLSAWLCVCAECACPWDINIYAICWNITAKLTFGNIVPGERVLRKIEYMAKTKQKHGGK